MIMNEEPTPMTDDLLLPLSQDELLRLWPLAAHAGHLQRQLLYVDYAQAERDAALLAGRLRDCLSADELATAVFAAIPRGGFIVLGLLSYYLDLRHDQLTMTAPAGAQTLVLVDDCALTGAMVEAALAGVAQQRIVVAHLYSTPALRTAVCAADPRVICCVAAHDLHEAPAAADAVGEQQMRAYLQDRFAAGAVQAVAFPWTEPASLILTPFAEQPDSFWRFLPPHRALNNRQALGLPAAAPVPRRWLAPDDVVYGRSGDTLYLLHTGKPEAYKLRGLAADVWRALAGYGAALPALAFLQQHYPNDREEALTAVLVDYAARFAALGLLQEAQTGAAP
jgi:hypothetical protein